MLLTPTTRPRTVAEHPAVRAYLREHETLTREVERATAERARLALDREALAASPVGALIGLGTIAAADVSTRAAQLDADFASADARLAKLQDALRHLERDGRGVREQAQQEIHARVLDEVREVLVTVESHFAAIEACAATLDSLRRHCAAGLPLAPFYVARLAPTFRKELAAFGVRPA